jgi:hypothetical protein
MQNYDKTQETTYIQYLDANNLYGHSMSQKLPYRDFEWVEMTVDDVIQYDCSGEKGCFVECDIDYPEELHNEHNNYPLAPETRIILKKELSPYQQFQLHTHKEKHSEKITKLIPNLYNKTKYVCHIKNLQYYLKKGLILKRIHRVLEFTQGDWLKPYIDFNTNKRKESKNEFEKDLYKLMNNAVFGKTMENMRGRVNIELITEENLAKKRFAKPQYQQHKIYSENLIAIKSAKTEVKLDKPIYVGLSVLDLSKLHMYEFHYDYMKPKYGDDITLLFTDTDSLCYYIKTDDLYRDNKENADRFDFSNYKFKRPLVLFNTHQQQLQFSKDIYRTCDKTNEKKIGCFKDETDGIPIVEFVGLRSKCYSVLLENEKDKKTCKGVKKSYVKTYLKHENYRNCILGAKQEQRQLASFNNLRSHDHKIGLFRFSKTALSCSNDKCYLLDNGITSYSYGHYKINE